ncbi:MAG: HAMP domain-containing histidine kinase [Calothrix sp. SM1_5_4]|nr:HAMP domain-containing histidine kinase [Calothrix sp. SM1_5_4]
MFGRIQRGDLKARFPTSRWDEAGQVLVLFNEMADEIERLVERLREKEKARVHLLQDLAHDLRTPVASLRTLLETLRFSAADLDEPQKLELTSLAHQESEYLTRLMEDMLLLALMIEPKYKAGSGTISAEDLVSSQLGVVAKSFPNIRVTIAGASAAIITGSPHLLKRLVRNALENAFSFARGEIDVETSVANGMLTLTIRDDGPGLSDEALAGFGKKRQTRYQSSGDEGGSRISVGLGSVIMQTIAVAHGGEISIHNLPGPDGKPAGAELVIRVPVVDGANFSG